MNQSEVERAVARATGESRRFIKHFGFSLITDEPEHCTNPALAIDCPGCGAAFNPDDVESSQRTRVPSVRRNLSRRR